MDIFHTFIGLLVIQLLTAMTTCDLVSSLSGSSEVIQCTLPFLSLYTVGYIQCQKICIRYYNCDVLQYNRYVLECHLYVASSCENSQDSVDTDVYLKRADINEAVFGNCQQDECPTSTCVQLQTGGHTCVLDRVLADYNSFGSNFVDIEGVVFGLYPATGNNTNSQQKCESYSGRLAILDTPKKMRILTAAIKQRSSLRWWIDGYKTVSGEMKWSTGELMTQVSVDHEDEECVVFSTDGSLGDNKCSNSWPCVCEM